MEKSERKYIKDNLPELMKDTEVTEMVLALLNVAGVLGPSDVDSLNTIHQKFAKNMKFYDLVQTRKDAYEKLIDAFEQDEQSGVVDILRKGKPVPIVQQAPPPVTVTPNVPPPPVSVAPNVAPSPVVQMNIPLQDDAGAPSPSLTESLDQVDFVNNMKPLTVSVLRPSAPMALPDDQYQLPYDNKGFALILNIIEFANSKRNRAGARLDTRYMEDLWTQLGYRVTVREGRFTFLEVDQILEDFKAQLTNYAFPTSCVVFIGSHGTFSKIESSDHREINLYKHVIYKFDSQNCPQLDGKPKIFLIQACQRFQHDGDETPAQPDRTEADGTLPTPIDDTLVCFSTTPGYLSNRDVFLGTWFTYCLAKVVMEEAHHMDILRMVKKTQATMRQINADTTQGQLCTYFDMGIKNVYFNMQP